GRDPLGCCGRDPQRDAARTRQRRTHRDPAARRARRAAPARIRRRGAATADDDTRGTRIEDRSRVSARTRALVVNHDGDGAPGIRPLAESGWAACIEVVIAALLRESSGSSAALTAAQVDGRIVVERQSLDGLDGVPVYGVDAAPGFIALIASRGAFGPRPEL